MPTVSVKLPEATKERLSRLAEKKGTTAHAFMVEAIESSLSAAEADEEFLEAATRSYEETLKTGLVYDGPEYLDYFRAKARGEDKPRPAPRRLDAYLNRKE